MAAAMAAAMVSQDVSMVRRSKSRNPHYTRTTITHSAPEFANQEQDVIRQSFSTGNYTWMKEALPVELGPDSVNLLRRRRMERNRMAEPVPQTWSKMTQLWGAGYYPEFEFIPDHYDRKHDFDRARREEASQKREKISNQDWRYASQELRLKHEAMIDKPTASEKELFPYLGTSRDLERVPYKTWLRVGMDCQSGASWGQGKGQLPPEASFLAGKGRGLEDEGKSSRMSLPNIVLRLQRRVDLDWEGTTVVVTATDQDLIQVAFHMATVDSERGVQAYMGVLSKDDDLLSKLGLRKLSQLWGVQRDFTPEDQEASLESSEENTWMFFLFMPKWVHMRPTDAYYTVHPREGGSAFRMSSAGSSVLLSALGSVTVGTNSPSASMRSTQQKASDSSGPSPSTTFRSSGPATARGKVDLSIAMKAAGALPPISESRSGAQTAR